MKKIILSLSLVFVLNGISFAQAPQLAEVLEWKYGRVASTCQENIHDESPNPKMVICGWRSTAPIPTESEISLITSDYVSSGQYAINHFDTQKALGEMAGVYTADRMIALAPYLSLIQNFMDFKNFQALKAIVSGMQTNGIVNQDDVNKLKTVLQNQNVNWDSITNL